jgi:hypothetical protein
MDRPVECTSCKVLMTSWSAAGSPVRYYQCPSCARTFCSAYGEVFDRRAGARVVERAEPPTTAPAAVPLPSAEELRWRELKGRANRWFERLEAEQRRCVRSASAGLAAASVGRLARKA